MKSKALSLAELLIAMTCISLLAILGVRGISVYLNQDTDIMKFRQVMGTVAQVAEVLSSDSVMYPTKRGFAETFSATYPGEEKEFGGDSKFKKLFKYQFNVMTPKVEFGSNKVGKVPFYKYKDGDQEKTYSDSFKKLDCFTENKGITYCLPFTPKDGSLTAIYIRVYLNAVNPNDEETFDNRKAVYFEVSNRGVVTAPVTLETNYGADNSQYIFDCSELIKGSVDNCISRAGYNQCKALCSIKNTNIITNVSSKK